VKSRFHQALQKKLLIFLGAVKLGAEPMERDDCTPAFHLGGAKNVFEDGDKEIYLGHSQNPPRVRRAATVQSLQNAFAAVLFPFRILSVTRIFHGFTHQARYLTAILHTDGQMLEDVRRYRAKWVDDHAWWVIRANAHSLFLLFITAEAVFLHFIVKCLAVDPQTTSALADVPRCII
jgi:hypothetical protein